jgi:hypothetical protein
MLNPVTATLDPPSGALPSLAARDEFGPIARCPGMFTATAAPVTADARDELGRPLDRFVPDGDLL